MSKPETITSAANPLLKDVRRAIRRGGLTDEGWAVAETFHLLEEALRSRCDVRAVLQAESARVEVNGVRVITLPDKLFQTISGTETAQGVMALIKPREWQMGDLFGTLPLLVVLDGLQDPGNAGAIVRAAEAFGASGIMFLKGTVSPYNPKTVRASAGSLFRVPFVHGIAAGTVRAECAARDVRIYAAVPRAAMQGNFAGGCALVIGSEAHGVSDDLRAAAEEVSIRTVGVESLNAAMAAGILLYEARRQRTVNDEPVR